MKRAAILSLVCLCQGFPQDGASRKTRLEYSANSLVEHLVDISLYPENDDYLKIVIHVELLPPLTVIRNVGCDISLQLKGDQRVNQRVTLTDRPPHYFIRADQPLIRYLAHGTNGVRGVYPRCLALKYGKVGASGFGSSTPAEGTDVLMQREEERLRQAEIDLEGSARLSEDEAGRILERLAKGELDNAVVSSDASPQPKDPKTKRYKKTKTKVTVGGP